MKTTNLLISLLLISTNCFAIELAVEDSWPPYATKVVKGTGLGLSSASQIINTHGGGNHR